MKFPAVLLAYFVIVFLTALMACQDRNFKSKSEADCWLQNETVKAQAVLATENNKRVTQLQMEVSKRCYDSGNLPIFMNGNVDCKPAPPKN